MSTVQPRRAARAIADLTAGSILATVDIAASPERVFRALASEDIVRWWGSDDMYRTTAWTGDVRVGGAWRSSGVAADGSEFSVGGEYLEVDPPRRLVHTWKPSWDEVGATTVTYTLAADPEGAWGVGLLRAKDEAEIKVFEAGDPVIRSERGFRYEILPMPRLIAR
jgi:uncharacterized protein YndB with AHSA1/START domain